MIWPLLMQRLSLAHVSFPARTNWMHTRLPVESLLHIKVVCKEGSNIINNSYFINIHLVYISKYHVLGFTQSHYHCYFLSAAEYDLQSDAHSTATKLHVHARYNVSNATLPPNIIGSCNGLLCLSFLFNQHLALFNPSACSIKFLPNIRKLYQSPFLSFGYGCCGEGCKIVSIPIVHLEKVTLEVFLCSLEPIYRGRSTFPSRSCRLTLWWTNYGTFMTRNCIGLLLIMMLVMTVSYTHLTLPTKRIV